MFRVFAVITDTYGARTVTRVGHKVKTLASAQKIMSKYDVAHITDDSSGSEVAVAFKGAGSRRASGASAKLSPLGRPEFSVRADYSPKFSQEARL